ncbi:hypothetical protein HFP64_00395 [Bacillus sp. AC79A.1]
MEGLKNQLHEWKKKSKQEKKKKPKEKLSTREIEDLMGCIDLVMNEDVEQ